MIGKPKRGKWHKVEPTGIYSEFALACNATHVILLVTFEDADEFQKTTGETIQPGWVCRHRVCREEVGR